VPAFFYQEFASESGPAGETEWRIRFTPEEAGTYSTEIRARDRSGTVSVRPSFLFGCIGRGSRLLRVSKRDPHYFEFEDGAPYFAVGENMVHGTLADYSRWMTKLAADEGIMAGFWMGYPEGLEVSQRGEYRLDIAWKFDQIMKAFRGARHLPEDLHRLHPVHLTERRARKTFDPEDNAYSVSNGRPNAGKCGIFFAPRSAKNVQEQTPLSGRSLGL